MEAPSGDELNEKLLVGRGQARVENLTSQVLCPSLREVSSWTGSPALALLAAPEACPRSNSTSHGELCPPGRHHLSRVTAWPWGTWDHCSVPLKKHVCFLAIYVLNSSVLYAACPEINALGELSGLKTLINLVREGGSHSSCAWAESHCLWFL